jgi:coenzyme Q-binding protein COQ10
LSRTHHVVRVLPYAPADLFALVGDVARYPEFVPWIVDMRTGPVSRPAEGVETLDADAAVGFTFLRERFATRVKRDSNLLQIEVDLIRGPFRKLANRWRFDTHPTGTKVVFDIDFEFKSRLLEALLHANFDYAVNKLINCFEERAAAMITPVAASQSVA